MESPDVEEGKPEVEVAVTHEADAACACLHEGHLGFLQEGEEGGGCALHVTVSGLEPRGSYAVIFQYLVADTSDMRQLLARRSEWSGESVGEGPFGPEEFAEYGARRIRMRWEHGACPLFEGIRHLHLPGDDEAGAAEGPGAMCLAGDVRDSHSSAQIYPGSLMTGNGKVLFTLDVPGLVGGGASCMSKSRTDRAMPRQQEVVPPCCT
jgi:hypothetical protein